MPKYNRTANELEVNAVFHWSSALLERERERSIIPLLLESQDKFISLLNIADSTPYAWKEALTMTSNFPANLFLKHLIVLADFGGEPLNRIAADIKRGSLFNAGKMEFVWRGKKYKYKFKQLVNDPRITNSLLSVDGKRLVSGATLNDRMEDVAMILLHGAGSIDADRDSSLNEKCIIGSLLGQGEEIEKFVRQRYIIVSRITSGAKVNSLGQIAQDFVIEYLMKELPTWKFKRNGSIPGITQNAGVTDTSFDIVATSPHDKRVAIEVSFQVTTNSVIERKAGQAEQRQQSVHRSNANIAYVIDGAGNFARHSALENICKFSDCTVALSEPELSILIDFLRSIDGTSQRRNK